MRRIIPDTGVCMCALLAVCYRCHAADIIVQKAQIVSISWTCHLPPEYTYIYIYIHIAKLNEDLVWPCE